MRVIDDQTLSFADLAGNQQYVTLGNISGEKRVALFLMDYPNRRRLKVMGQFTVVPVEDRPVRAALAVPRYRGRVERSFLIRLAAFDWNCPQHITPRFFATEVDEMATTLAARVELQAENSRLRLGD
ncbi:MAG: hypothetical protein AAFQ42_06050 [Pseudomonadota bacterium]